MPEMGLTGSIHLKIDEKALKATLVFSSDRSGATWNIEKLKKLLASKQLKVETIKLQNALEKFEEEENERPYNEFTLLKGTPPGPSEPDRIEWEKLIIPEVYKGKAEIIFRNATEPEVYAVQEIKKKIRQRLEKKPSMPFLKPKIREIEKEKNEVIKVRVNVKPEVISRGYVQKGDLLATIYFGRNGSSGKDIFGNIIPSQASLKVILYINDTVDISTVPGGQEIIAGIDGFIRRGSNWVDIIPYHEHSFNVYVGINKTSCLFDFIPGTVEFPEVERIFEKAGQLGFKQEDLITKEELTALMKDSVLKEKKIRGLSISRTDDSSFAINISPDKLKATITIKKAVGKGKPLSLKEIGQAIIKQGFKGMDIKKVQADILAFYKGEEGELVDYVLIERKPLRRGKDGVLTYKVDFKQEEDFRKTRDKLGHAAILQYFPVSGVERIASVTRNQMVAEIIPPSEGASGIDIFGDTLPGVTGNHPNIQLFDNLKLVKNKIYSSISGLFLISRKYSTRMLTVCPFQDGVIAMRISEDKMQAFVSLKPPEGAGEQISMERISQTLKDGGVVKGINLNLIKQLAQKVRAGEEVYDVAVAQGLPACHGSGQRLIFHHKSIKGHSLYVRRNMDLKKQTPHSSAKQGDLIAEILSPKIKPKNGWDVMGHEILAREGLPIQIEIGKNLKKVIEPDGTIKIFADKNGEVFYDGNLLEIKDSMRIDGDVGIKTGHIQFSGSIQVYGNINSGYKVFSGADIMVGGMVKGAVLSSEGSIYIKQGVKGENKAILRSKNNIQTPFLENTVVLAVGNIQIDNTCHLCKIKCNSKLSFNPVKSSLVGGNIKVKKGLEVLNIGSERNIMTTVSFGQDYLVSDQIELEEREIERLKKRIMMCNQKLIAIGHDKDVKNERIDRIRKEKLVAMRLLEKRSVRLFNLREKYEQHFPSEIMVHGAVFPGVVFESHGRVLKILLKKSKVRIFFNQENGKIEMESLGSVQ